MKNITSEDNVLYIIQVGGKDNSRTLATFLLIFDVLF